MGLLSAFALFLAAPWASITQAEFISGNMNAFRHPVVAVSHGAGPLWLLDEGAEGLDKHSQSAKNVADIFSKIYTNDAQLPKRILFISAHWEARSTGLEISKSASPEMFYDYSGFPAEAYELVYGAEGDPEFAIRVKKLLEQSGITSKLVDRPFDHGTFVPMFLMRPQADIPIVTMSINDRMFDPNDHFKLGKALAPLRDEDTLIITSGQATHNMYADWFPEGHPIEPWALEFQSWLDKTLSSESTQTYKERMESVIAWKKAPYAMKCHRTPDHFTTFVVGAGVGMEEDAPAAKKLNGGWGLGHMSFASYAWGVDSNLSGAVKDEL
ncbi:Catalytic LigB subunit of aromatic ring-opening dioxygenase [Phytophthora infestans]|uniref:Catalytic LigB subunit of aromatic ring-opening dioxygenase n=1 Tax=Phytophthora infestans TaxID=4787 RepID=A0A8S9UBR2_PHYIN|nr:Catalytic LigB subunit of aromatic ring-opening dioxygenase [Phytophthora infestans]